MKRSSDPAYQTSTHTYSSPRKFIYVVKQLIEVVDEKRQGTRIPKRLSLKVQPLDDDFRPDGEPFCALSSDLSKKGIGFVSDDRMSHEYIRIMLLEQDVSVIAQVRHSTSIGTEYPLYLVGVEFLDEYLL